MAASTLPSTFGPLAIHDNDLPNSPASKLPRLQFEDFDLVIKLDDDPELWLLVHSDVISKSCRALAPSFSDNWEKHTSSAPNQVEHPRTGKQVHVRTRVLKRVDRTWLVEGPGVMEDEDGDTVLFCQSDLALPGWSGIVPYWHDNLHMTKRSLRLFFALLYGTKVQCEHLCSVDKAHKVTATMINDEVLPLLANVGAYAKYFGCWIADNILPILTSSPAYGEAIALEPTKHCLLAKKLEDADLYQDALRHMIAQAHLKGYWQDIAEITGWDENQIREFFTPQIEALRIKTQDLREHLQKLQLGRVRAKYYRGGWHEAHTRLLDLIAIEQNPGPVRVVAGFIYSELLTYVISGEKVSETRDSIRGEKAGRLNLLIHKIQRAANSPYPASLFDAATAVHYADTFHLSKEQLRELEQHLHCLVREANHIIEFAFPVITVREHSMGVFETDQDWLSTYVEFTTARARYDAHYDGYFTYLKVPDILPWDPENDHGPSHTLTSVNVTDVSPDWLTALEHHYGASE